MLRCLSHHPILNLYSFEHVYNIYMCSKQGRTGTENRPRQFPLTTLPAQPNFHSTDPTFAKSKKSPVFHTKITLFITSTLQPTGHCPNASMASLPLASSYK